VQEKLVAEQQEKMDAMKRLMEKQQHNKQLEQ